MALGIENISTNLVSTTLVGTTSLRDVGTLCTHPAINKWSRWKPIRLNKVTGITESDLATANYGISIPNANGDYHNVSNVGWVYLKPRGVYTGVTEHFRLGDFRNYRHDAEPYLCSGIKNTIDNINNPPEFDILHAPYYFRLGQQNPLTGGYWDGCIVPTDLAGFYGDGYFTIILEKYNAQNQLDVYFGKSASAKISTGAAVVQFDKSDIRTYFGTGGSYQVKVHAVISSVPFSGGVPEGTPEYYPVDNEVYLNNFWIGIYDGLAGNDGLRVNFNGASNNGGTPSTSTPIKIKETGYFHFAITNTLYKQQVIDMKSLRLFLATYRNSATYRTPNTIQYTTDNAQASANNYPNTATSSPTNITLGAFGSGTEHIYVKVSGDILDYGATPMGRNADVTTTIKVNIARLDEGANYEGLEQTGTYTFTNNYI